MVAKHSPRLAAAASEWAAAKAADHELPHKSEVRGDIRSTPRRQFRAKHPVKAGQMIPRHPGIEVMFQVVILIAHKKSRHAVRKNGARSAHGIAVMLFEQGVLAHPPNIDK